MMILALEFSANNRSVAVAETQPDGRVQIRALEGESDFRGVTGLAIVDRALNKAKIARSDITRIAVGLGPGSYTGIRSAIAIAQGWQLGRNVELLGISSVDCQAEQARSLGMNGLVSIVIDAQRGEVYVARYDVGSTGVQEVEELRIAAPSDVHASDIITGPDATKFFPTGRDMSPSAETLAHLAARETGETDFIAGEQLEPIYLRAAAFVKAPVPREIR